MAYGLRIWDANGNVTLDVTDRLARYIGSVYTGTSDGSIVVPGMGGNIFYSISFSSSSMAQFYTLPVVSISGDVINWVFERRADGTIPATIFYGRY
ncbi:MAG: hypothetical protein LBP58_02970 [Azoarcus sp.]|jgi:hypothetical protein|nr:hypothetical protein [Azoarcus sp.]